MQRPCNAKVVATPGPSSADRETIEVLVRASADVFRLNFSHGTHADHKQRLDLIRDIESELGCPIGVLLDLQGPKLRVGTFAGGPSSSSKARRSASTYSATSPATARVRRCRIRKFLPH